MKKIYTLAFGCLAAYSVQAQSDTLIWEDFNGETWEQVTETELLTQVGNSIVYELSPGFIDDTKWYNIDLDGFTDANDRPVEWFRSYALTDADSADFDGVYASSSWFTPFGVANNWLITKYFYCSADAELSWYSAPRQTPLYLDGYKVMVSTSSNDPLDFLTTIFTAKEYDGLNTGDSCLFSNYDFAPSGSGFVHGEDGTYITDNGDVPADCQRNWGSLQKHTVSLSQFAGQHIYIAFVHDSDDDNLITLDNVLVMGTYVDDAKIEENQNFTFTLYPNPASDRIILGYELNGSSDVNVKVIDNTGRVVKTVNQQNQNGNSSTTLDISELANGIYTVTLETAQGRTSKKFIKG